MEYKCVAGLLDTELLFKVIADSRVFKSPEELDLMRHVADLSSQSHVYTMRESKPGMTEWQQEAMFNHYSYFYFGCRIAGYTAICACGPNAATLHYGHAGAPNDFTIKDRDMCLLDMGSEYHCYGADITCSFPVSSTKKFTEKQRIVYTAVLEAQLSVYEILAPGVSWVDCHRAAEKAILENMMKAGLVVLADAKDVEELIEKRVGAVFMPHGLGHFIGIDTHDVGGYLEGHPKRHEGPGLSKLRTARIMQENMCLTVEPGCYFIDCVIDDALADPNKAKHLVADKIAEFRGTGGVRLEDVLAITADGCVNYTNCPRTIDEVECVIGGGKWPPAQDVEPRLRRKFLVK